MSLVQDHHVIQAFTADTPDQPLDIRILLRTPWGNQHFFDAHGLRPLPKSVTIDPIAVAEEIPTAHRPVPAAAEGRRLHAVVRGRLGASARPALVGVDTARAPTRRHHLRLPERSLVRARELLADTFDYGRRRQRRPNAGVTGM
jgi:hypothetical protein